MEKEKEQQQEEQEKKEQEQGQQQEGANHEAKVAAGVALHVITHHRQLQTGK